MKFPASQCEMDCKINFLFSHKNIIHTEYHLNTNVQYKVCLSLSAASVGVTVLVMVTLIVLLSVLGLQVSWQEIRILKLVDVLEDPFLLQEIKVF